MRKERKTMKYEKPEFQTIELKILDVITNSPEVGGSQNGDGEYEEDVF